MSQEFESKDSLESAKDLLREALRPFFKGKTAEQRLESASEKAMDSIAHLITTESDVSKRRLGVTVMTESASINKGLAPRSV